MNDIKIKNGKSALVDQMEGDVCSHQACLHMNGRMYMNSPTKNGLVDLGRHKKWV